MSTQAAYVAAVIRLTSNAEALSTDSATTGIATAVTPDPQELTVDAVQNFQYTRLGDMSGEGISAPGTTSATLDRSDTYRAFRFLEGQEALIAHVTHPLEHVA